MLTTFANFRGLAADLGKLWSPPTTHTHSVTLCAMQNVTMSSFTLHQDAGTTKYTIGHIFESKIQDCQIKDRSLLVFVLFIIYMQYNCPVASTMFQVFAKVLSLQAVKLQCSRCSSVQRVQSPEARDGQITLVHHHLRE